jgi:hypothetical protein
MLAYLCCGAGCPHLPQAFAKMLLFNSQFVHTHTFSVAWQFWQILVSWRFATLQLKHFHSFCVM